MATILKTFGITAIFLVVLLFTTISAQTTTSSQCRQPPTLIPDTFSISYQPIDETSGTIYFTYLEPSWENWPMFDIRELASEPFVADLTVDLSEAYLDFDPSLCQFSTPQSFLRSDPATGEFNSADPTLLDLVFSQTGTFSCPAKPTQFNIQGKQQQSVQGHLHVKQYICDPDTLLPTSESEDLDVDGASKVSLPDLFMHVPCSRLTLNFQSTSQLTLKQTNGLALDIDKHPSLVVELGQTPITRLHAYSVSQTDNLDEYGQTIYQNQLSFCSFNSSLSDDFNPADLFALNTNLDKVSYSIKSSKIPSYCYDGVKNFDESDIDCGGTGKLNGCPPCVDSSQICQGNADCVSSQCISHQLAGKRCFAYSNAITSALSVTVVAISAIAIIFM